MPRPTLVPDDYDVPDWVSEPRSSLVDSNDAPTRRRSDRRRGDRELRHGHHGGPRHEESQEQWRRERRERRLVEPARSSDGERPSTPDPDVSSLAAKDDSLWLTRAERRRRLERENARRHSSSRRRDGAIEMVPPAQRVGPETRSLRRTAGSVPRTRPRPFAQRRLLATLALTTSLVLLLWSFWPSTTSPERGQADLSATALRQKSDPTPAAEGLPTAPAPTSSGGTKPAPQTGTGKLDAITLPTIAAPSVNPNRTVRVGVKVERGAGVDAEQAASIISSTLGDERGWQTLDEVRFRAVSPAAVAAGDVDITIVLASPDLTDKLCAPLKTRGEVSCFNLRTVVLNVRRWTKGVPGYGANLADYRKYMVNHEIGHGLYHGHVECPSAGALAPIMLQQTKGLDGCRPNPWPTVG